jgi:anaerobic ribonucleoside-triphosphate reductase
MINLAGLKETMESFFGKNVSQEGSAKLIEDLTECVSSFVRKAGKRRGRRLLSAMLPDHEASTRLAQLDIDRYGVGKVKFSGTRENPHYSTFSELSVQDKQISSDALSGIHKLRGLCTGGSLIVVELGESEYDPDELLSLTKQITECGGLEFFTYSRRLTYCTNCRQSWLGMLRKCPSCGAVSSLKVYDRYSPQ